MCGLIGYIGKKNCKSILLDCLKKLEYRGYDSSGVILITNKDYQMVKCIGNIHNLEEKLKDVDTSDCSIGVGHTRWATHGIVNETNAHPHEGKTCILVHNGIIENHEKLRKDLLVKNHSFYSNVDSEVIAKLIDEHYCENHLDTLKIICNKLEGSFALNIIFKDELDKIYIAKKDSPLIIGIDQNVKYISSDINSISDYCKDFIYVNEKSYGIISENDISLYDFKGNKLIYELERLEMLENETDKKGYDYYMLKEIEEEPIMFENILKNNLENGLLKVNLEEYKGINKIVIIGCGTAMHAGLIGKYYLEKFAKIDVDVEIASEYRYKDLILNNKTLAIFISQSGETADTLACLKMLKEKNIKTLSFVNVYNSSIAKLSDKTIYTNCGKEIAIASTKALVGQSLLLILFALKLANLRNKLSMKQIKEYTKYLSNIPSVIEKVLKSKEPKNVAKLINKNKNIVFIGRGIDYYLSLESSLKLKEITYIPSQCYQAGELKHGPISLVDDKTLVFVLNTNESTLSKTLSNLQEVKSRNGNTYLVSTNENSDYKVEDTMFAPLFSCMTFFQLVAYHTALSRKLDIDKPRNLAKSVTVE